ncbi:uncharacterized protein LOC119683337 [Teleopsis dalmanni]|uniref:uncharacterized protein LOC119683337 n=1 Tax=Teleopsis dalmanni TaxID=139649 RepID=UPI000D32C06A|nr:uncharacterized protein LOC119683337 [Teleopsis dalmanni]
MKLSLIFVGIFFVALVGFAQANKSIAPEDLKKHHELKAQHNTHGRVLAKREHKGDAVPHNKIRHKKESTLLHLQHHHQDESERKHRNVNGEKHTRKARHNKSKQIVDKFNGHETSLKRKHKKHF